MSVSRCWCLLAARGLIWIKPWHCLSCTLFQALDACQSDSQAADDDVSSCRRLENKGSAQQSSSEPQHRKDYHRHFRQRSASDTNIATLPLSESYFTCFFPFSPFVLICLFNILIASLKKNLVCTVAILFCVCLVQESWMQAAEGSSWV